MALTDDELWAMLNDIPDDTRDRFCAVNPEHLSYFLTDLLGARAEIARLTGDRDQLLGMVEEVATACPDRYSGRAHDPQDDMPDMIEADVFDALQSDAKAILEARATTRQAM